MVALHAVDGRVDDLDGSASLFDDTLADTLDGEAAGLGIADDAAFADAETAGFELRLDEDDGGALPATVRRAEGAEDRGENQRGGDEGDVHGEEDRNRGVGREEFAGGEEAGVGAFVEGDAGIVAELLGDLAVAGVDGDDAGRMVLQHAVGEAAGGGSDVDAGASCKVDRPVFESAFELEAAAANVLQIRTEEADDGCGRDAGARLVDALIVDKDAAGKDEGLGALAGGCVALIHEELVETQFFGTCFSEVAHCSASIEKAGVPNEISSAACWCFGNGTGSAGAEWIAHAGSISGKVALVVIKPTSLRWNAAGLPDRL